MKTAEVLFKKIDNKDLGLLFIRLGLGLTLIMHGTRKVLHGVGHLQGDLLSVGFPEIISHYLAYLVYVGEILAPIMLILGIFARMASVFVLGTCFFIFLVKSSVMFGLDPKTGGLVLAEAYFYVFCSLAIFFGGSGKYALKKD